ncbi:flagellar protein FliS [Oribacterium sp. KHPX15]|uniref:flagellar export chaperone FliS n=1 Tax=unclassified Oribacterium TaxID=2629782 RepID=UPI0004E171F7|nr:MULTISPECIES: flagellar export chaperone FliS [unclassified Oribacterium]SEA42761.1 flagellar protein FliS [Oribacterium sp. KHPX15]
MSYEKYKENTLFSMSPVELLVLLYDECMKDLRKAHIALEDGDMTMFEEYVGKALKIIRYLINTLDMSVPVSSDLRRLYDYIIYDISKVRASGKRMAGEIPRIIEIIQDLRDGFDGASKVVQDTHEVRQASVVG